jgi:hypothetical protein
VYAYTLVSSAEILMLYYFRFSYQNFIDGELLSALRHASDQTTKDWPYAQAPCYIEGV